MHCRYPVLALIGLISACGGPSEEEYPERLSEAYCRYLERCDALAFSTDECEDALTSTIEDSFFFGPGTRFKTERTQFSSENAAECLRAIESSSCTSFPLYDGASSCYRIYEGSAKSGESCYALECAPDLYCSASIDTCPGACIARVADGGAATNGSTCALGLVLFQGVCRAPVALDHSCAGRRTNEHSVCDSGLYCDEVTQSCKKLRVQGEACDSKNPCGHLLVCASGVCAPPGAQGTSCEASNFCRVGLACQGNPGSRRCLPLQPAGGSCTESGQCEPGLTCYGGACRARVQIGGGCSEAQCVDGAYCDASQICAAQKAPGASCSSFDECDSGYCGAQGVCVRSYCAP